MIRFERVAAVVHIHPSFLFLVRHNSSVARGPPSSSAAAAMNLTPNLDSMELVKLPNYVLQNPRNEYSKEGTRTFWLTPVKYVHPTEVKKNYALERAIDKKSRFYVRGQIRKDGVISNLFPIHLLTGDEALERSPLYKYEMYVTRELPATNGTSGDKKTKTGKGKSKETANTSQKPEASGAALKRVSPLRAWKTIRHSLLRNFGSLPPIVQLNHYVFAAGPLPANALQIPKEFLDISWRTCELRLVEKTTLSELDPSEAQELINKIAFWCVKGGPMNHKKGDHNSEREDRYSLVRERVGKVVSLDSGITSGGLRVFKGTNISAVYVDEHEIEDGNVPRAARSAKVTEDTEKDKITSTELRDVAVGVTPREGPPLHFQVHSFIRAFTYKEKKVESYKIGDASGVYLASIWEPAEPQKLKIGGIYEATHVRVREFPEKNNLRLFEFTDGQLRLKEQQSSTSAGAHAAETTKGKDNNRESKKENESFTRGAANTLHPGILCLKIDTKGTIASETSLWDEVKQHYGCGPYDEETQRRIARSVQGTPVVVSHTMEQAVVRFVTFPADNSALINGPKTARPSREEEQQSGMTTPRRVNMRLRALLPHLEPNQPFVVLPDYSTQPLQVLHCCFDPRMKGWQDTAVSILSLMPQKRMELLTQVSEDMQRGLALWGLHLSSTPLKTKQLSLLPLPNKIMTQQMQGSSRGALRHPPPPPFPTSMLVIGIMKERQSAEEKSRVTLTVQQMAKYYRTNMVAAVDSESEAVRVMAEKMLVPDQSPPRVRDPNSVLILVTPDRELRATRWVMAEALSRGILPVLVPPASSPKRAALLCGNIKRQIATKFEVNPLRGINLEQEVPVVRGKRVLIVGVDSCHTNVISTGAVVGILQAPERNHVLPFFWKHEARGREVHQVGEYFGKLLEKAVSLYNGLDEVIVLQDGDVFSELHAIKEQIAASLPRCGLTFMCLHKRTNIRFAHDNAVAKGGHAHGKEQPYLNMVKGVVVPALTPVGLDYEVVAPSFYLQSHESNMSTARPVLYTVHHLSPTLDIGDVQLICNIMANILSPQATKLPMSTRCAHRLADQSERLLDAVPQLEYSMIPAPLNERLWFL